MNKTTVKKLMIEANYLVMWAESMILHPKGSVREIRKLIAELNEQMKDEE